MQRFKSRQSQRASEEWFRTNIRKKEQVSRPRASSNDDVQNVPTGRIFYGAKIGAASFTEDDDPRGHPVYRRDPTCSGPTRPSRGGSGVTVHYKSLNPFFPKLPKSWRPPSPNRLGPRFCSMDDESRGRGNRRVDSRQSRWSRWSRGLWKRRKIPEDDEVQQNMGRRPAERVTFMCADSSSDDDESQGRGDRRLDSGQGRRSTGLTKGSRFSEDDEVQQNMGRRPAERVTFLCEDSSSDDHLELQTANAARSSDGHWSNAESSSEELCAESSSDDGDVIRPTMTGPFATSVTTYNLPSSDDDESQGRGDRRLDSGQSSETTRVIPKIGVEEEEEQEEEQEVEQEEGEEINPFEIVVFNKSNDEKVKQRSLDREENGIVESREGEHSSDKDELKPLINKPKCDVQSGTLQEEELGPDEDELKALLSAMKGMEMRKVGEYSLNNFHPSTLLLDEELLEKPKPEKLSEIQRSENVVQEEEEENKVECVEKPTDGFGTICFVGMGNKQAEYARLSSNTELEKLYELLTELWKIPAPNLLISVTGGAKNFRLKPHLKNMFHRGLIQVAQTTGAWILTAGTNSGVVKHVGQAVRDQALSSSDSRQIVAIGIATWGMIHNRHQLVNPKGYCQARYKVDVKGQGNLTCLDHNHTHFLLVDDGTEGQPGAEMDLREQLEKYISEKELGNQVTGVKIPVVYVTLNGDFNTLNTVHTAAMNGIPCVVMEGSGGMADVLAHVADKPMNHVTIDVVRDLIQKFFGQEFGRILNITILQCTKKIQDIIRTPHLLTVFRDTADNDEDVDIAILQALLKASRNGDGSESYSRQLELALAWNRVDIAKNEIFTDESQWKTEQLHDAMFSALVENKPQFVSLLLENGVALDEFLQETTLYDLYKHLPNCLFLKRLTKHKRSRSVRKDQSFITRASAEARQLLKSYTLPNISKDAVVLGDIEMSTPSVSETFLKSGNPERDLFLWAVLHNNKEIAEIAWRECQDCITAALAASKILKKLGREVYREADRDEGKEAQELAELYEKRAIDVFSECYSSDEERAHKLLLRESPLWKRATCLSLALEANNQNFIAQSGVQALLTKLWCGNLSVDNSVWRVMMCIVFFPLIYIPGFLDFRRDEELEREEEEEAVVKAVKTNVQDEEENERRAQRTALGVCERPKALYTSLQVKFYLHIVSYLAFLGLFAVVLLVHFHPTPSLYEIVLYAWTFTLACEELRQLFYDPQGMSYKKKLKLHFYDLWNVLDALSIVFCVIGLVLRMLDGWLYVGKVVLCIDFIIFCLRLMAIFTINQTLGPKIIIIRRMMKDLFVFMFLLSIWVVAYGVAKHGILIHNEDRPNWILRGAIYEPYLTLFGELPKNIDHSEFEISSCTKNGSDPLKPRCPVLNSEEMPAFPEWLTIIMLCVYMLFANILLLNLLIAILSFTFQEVHDNNDRIWKFQRYELIYEYSSRPVAPPPFIFLCHLYMLLRAVLCKLWRSCISSCCRSAMHASEEKLLKEDEVEEDKRLMFWEAIMKDRYLSSIKQAQTQSTEQRIQDTHHKVSNICECLDRGDEPDFSSVEQRLTRLQEQVTLLLGAQEWNNCGENVIKKQNASINMTEVDHFSGSSPSAKIHVEARRFYYADRRVRRFPVPEEKVSWEVSFSCYDPPYFSPNATDDTERFVCQHFRVDKNPAGRTGIQGRGVLPNLGENLRTDFIFIRDGAHLEFLALKKEDGELTFPGAEEKPSEDRSAFLSRIMGDFFSHYSAERIGDMYEEMLMEYEGYVDDVRNTDNAWVKTTVRSLQLQDGPLLSHLNALVSQTSGSGSSFEWHEVSKGRTSLSSFQRDLLQTVARRYDSKF